MGFGPDSSYLLGNYFSYALQKEVVAHSYNQDVYIALLGPIQGTYDRACELY